MGFCPNCGNWVDEGDICGCCGGSGSYSYEKDNGESEINQNFPKRDEYANKAWECHLEFKDEDALQYINLALNLDKWHSNNWNIKAIILEGLKKYEESEVCYDKSLELSFNNLICDNKVRMLYWWVHQLIEESKELPNGLSKLEKAKEKNIKAISSHLGENSEEDIDKYLTQRDTIEYYINYEKEYQKNLETLKSFNKNELFTITGRKFYKNNINLTSGMSLKLVKEPDNEYDNNAIAVYAEVEKIGYVANNEYTKYELTSSASELQDKIQDTAQGSYLFYLERYAEIQFPIGRIIK